MLCKLRFAGCCEVPRPWVTTVSEGVNRLYYIHGGEGGYIRGGKRIPFVPGYIYILPAFLNTETYTDPDNRLVHTYVNFELVPPIISSDVLALDPKSDAVTDSVFKTLELLASMATKSVLSKEDKVLLIDTVTYLISKAVSVSSSALLDDEVVNKALKIMISRMKDGLTVADIAAECFMSTDGFIRRFTRTVGMTPYAYYKKLKLRAAAAMRDEGATLEEAAERCGYSDASALLHAMKISPIPTF